MKVGRITAFCTGILFAAISLSSPLAAAPQTGIASVYSGEQTANGEYAHASALTAAHRTLPFGTMVKVTNLLNQEIQQHIFGDISKLQMVAEMRVGF